MAKLSTKVRNSNAHVMVFGPPKSGKTALVGKLAKKYKLIWFDIDAGIDTLKQMPQEWQENVDYISIPDTRSFPIAIQTVLKIIKGGVFDICETHGAIGCVACKKSDQPFFHVDTLDVPDDTILVFDSITQLQSSGIAHITKGKPEDYRLEWEDWAHLGILMDTFLSHVQQAKFKVVCISHETEVEMEDGTNKLVPTTGTRNFSRNSAKYFGEVIYCEIVNKGHKAASSTLYKGTVLTGSRTGSVLEKEKEPSLMAIFDPDYVPAVVTQENTPETSPAVKSLNQLRLKIGPK